jgi:hypothetical protein
VNMRKAISDLEESQVRVVANAGAGLPDVLAFGNQFISATPNCVYSHAQVWRVRRANAGLCCERCVC